MGFAYSKEEMPEGASDISGEVRSASRPQSH